MSDDRHTAELNANTIFETTSIDEVISDDSLSLSALVEKARSIANKSIDQTLLTKHHTYVSLGKLLHALLEYASHDELDGSTGIRYTAAVICSSHKEGRLQDAALVWIEHLFLPIKAARASITVYPTTEQTPETMQTVKPVKQFREQLLIREGYRCAVHRNEVHRDCSSLTVKQTGDIPFYRLEGCHIIPYSLNRFSENELRNTPVTWTLLKHWASYDFQHLIGQSINNSINGILMCPNLHEAFGMFGIYFLPAGNERDTYHVHVSSQDKDKVYARCTFKACDEIPVPSPKLLAVHAALARVLYASGAGDYIDAIWRDRDAVGCLATDGSSDPRVLSYSLAQ